MSFRDGCPIAIEKSRFFLGLLSLGAAALTYFTLPEPCPEAAKRMTFIFILAALLWALEIIPLFSTSILVVILEIFLLPGETASPINAVVFLAPLASPVILLFFGSFVLAAAFHKHGIDRYIAGGILRYSGRKPYGIILGFMLTTGFLSMLISNTAAAALMLTLIYPILSDNQVELSFKKALVLAVAFAASIGGIATPVGTPPNAIALGLLAEQGIHIRFLSWTLAAFPLALILLFITSALIYFLFPSRQAAIHLPGDSCFPRSANARAVMLIAVLTFSLWLTASWHSVPEFLAALLSVVLLSTAGCISHEDIKKIDWDILLLMWGGLALGVGVQSSGLAEWVIRLPFFSHQGFPLIAVFSLLSMTLSTFISNTAAVSLLLPIAVNIPGADALLLGIGIALASSFDLALPMSTPPMAMAYGTRVVRVKDMLKAGIFFTLLANLILLSSLLIAYKAGGGL